MIKNTKYHEIRAMVNGVEAQERTIRLIHELIERIRRPESTIKIGVCDTEKELTELFYDEYDKDCIREGLEYALSKMQQKLDDDIDRLTR